MSIALMADVWKSTLPMTEKMVLLCLADFANDRGECWPSIDTIADKCSCSDRTVQKAIKSLRAMGILVIQDKPGRAHQFRIEGGRIFTPEECSPPKISAKGVKDIHHRGEPRSPKPSSNHQEPPKMVREKICSNNPAKPDGVQDQTWLDFQDLRKRKRAPLTATAMAGIEREARKAGWPLEAVLAKCLARGWQGFESEWVKDERPETQAAGGVDPMMRSLMARKASASAAA